MEVCVDCVESAINAEKGGATSLELCTSLLEGGLTPSIGLLRKVKEIVDIPVFVMIRPRSGDFLYTGLEIEVMKEDISCCKENGADGIVFGILTREGNVDKERCLDLIDVARPLPVSFHRAFDLTSNWKDALGVLINLGFERVLTSGQDTSALDGLPVIRDMVQLAADRILVIPAGGISERNIERILEGSCTTEFHCSARKSFDSAMIYRNSRVSMGGAISLPEYTHKVTDAVKVKSIRDIARHT
ncbi:PREDICTED: copper homeostasis protein cutC homolog [Priapulus caudatus]|uniref:Copper homeostasis protein cutC homolog n=1 Tax=Priapulus caudatus TaxID=37621 RepID=A0ABM1DSL1_PRICU|nr:PREDICTED: copper homeostasis protein cutC homolog [Priapulus caudatus]